MGKDAIDTFKPFKSSYYIKRDLLQPIQGAINLYNGIKNIGNGPPLRFVLPGATLTNFRLETYQ